MKPILELNKKVMDSVVLTSTQSSGTIDIAEVRGYCAHIVWSAGATGSLTVEGSDEDVDASFVPVDTTAIAGSAGKRLFNQDGIHYRYVRIKYTFTSGTGTMTAYLSGKR